MSRKMRVCVVDDDAEATTILCEGLRLNDYVAVEAHSGREALKLCGTEEIDLVLLDIRMPEMDGYEVIENLKSNDATQHIPVIFVSAKDRDTDVQRGLKLGAVEYITKPYNLPMVMVCVEAALNAAGARSESGGPEFMDSGYTDLLTGLRNKRYLVERLQEEVDKAHRYDYPVSCVMIDINDVTALDEECGPVSDDDLLAEIALGLRSYTRAHDVLARFDGRLFTALLPHTQHSDAMGYAHKIVNDVESTIFSDPNFPSKAIASCGVVTCQNGSATNADRFLGEAMQTLFQALGQSELRVAGRDLSA